MRQREKPHQCILARNSRSEWLPSYRGLVNDSATYQSIYVMPNLVCAPNISFKEHSNLLLKYFIQSKDSVLFSVFALIILDLTSKKTFLAILASVQMNHCRKFFQTPWILQNHHLEIKFWYSKLNLTYVMLPLKVWSKSFSRYSMKVTQVFLSQVATHKFKHSNFFGMINDVPNFNLSAKKRYMLWLSIGIQSFPKEFFMFNLSIEQWFMPIHDGLCHLLAYFH